MTISRYHEFAIVIHYTAPEVGMVGFAPLQLYLHGSYVTLTFDAPISSWLLGWTHYCGATDWAHRTFIVCVSSILMFTAQLSNLTRFQ